MSGKRSSMRLFSLRIEVYGRAAPAPSRNPWLMSWLISVAIATNWSYLLYPPLLTPLPADPSAPAAAGTTPPPCPAHGRPDWPERPRSDASPYRANLNSSSRRGPREPVQPYLSQGAWLIWNAITSKSPGLAWVPIRWAARVFYQIAEGRGL